MGNIVSATKQPNGFYKIKKSMNHNVADGKEEEGEFVRLTVKGGVIMLTLYQNLDSDMKKKDSSKPIYTYIKKSEIQDSKTRKGLIYLHSELQKLDFLTPVMSRSFIESLTKNSDFQSQQELPKNIVYLEDIMDKMKESDLKDCSDILEFDPPLYMCPEKDESSDSDNTMMYIGIGVAVVVLIACIVYFMNRKK